LTRLRAPQDRQPAGDHRCKLKGAKSASPAPNGLEMKLVGAKIGSAGPIGDEEVQKEGAKMPAAASIRAERCENQT
jgi:hypothetical protein